MSFEVWKLAVLDVQTRNIFLSLAVIFVELVA